MSSEIPEFPIESEPLKSSHPSAETLELLARRRSTVAKNMCEPGPTGEQLEALLKIAARVPDHGKLHPWRFIVFEGEARTKFSHKLEARFRETEPDAPQERYELERRRFERAPVVVAVISSVQESTKIDTWEQVLSVGAVCQNLLLASNAMGFAAQWLTEWYAYDDAVNAMLGLTKRERVAGFIYIGTASEEPKERVRKAPSVLHMND